MFADFAEAGLPSLFSADVCIIGAGAAGITIARTFVGTRTTVCVVESGGRRFQRETQALYEGEIVGAPYVDLDACRMRMFGGSTAHWGGWCAPYDEIDFEKREWVPYSGWPFTRAELDPFYRRAQDVCSLGTYRYDRGVWDEIGMSVEAPDRGKLDVAFIRARAERFADAFGGELDAAPNVTVLLNANVVDIAANEAGTAIDRVALRSLQGRTAVVRARRYVLACGGIENARLLLSSDTVHRSGLGNQRGLVGRFLMDHPPMDFPPPAMRCATVLAPQPERLMSAYGTFARPGLRYVSGFRLSPQLQRARGMLNCWGWLDQRDVPGAGADALRARPAALDARIRAVLMHMSAADGLAAARASLPAPVQSGATTIALLSQGEQAPNPDSRVTLAGERDALGMRRVRVDWRPTELDKRSVRFWTETVGAELLRMNLGRLRLESWLIDGTPDWPMTFRGAWHHIGTTRMSSDASAGVVDETCRVHGVANLFVAGCSVFPTSGWVNPTLTIVAMSLRLADHLARRLA